MDNIYNIFSIQSQIKHMVWFASCTPYSHFCPFSCSASKALGCRLISCICLCSISQQHHRAHSLTRSLHRATLTSMLLLKNIFWVTCMEPGEEHRIAADTLHVLGVIIPQVNLRSLSKQGKHVLEMCLEVPQRELFYVVSKLMKLNLLNMNRWWKKQKFH